MVHQRQEGGELAEVHAHLIDELADGHLLGSGELVEVAAPGARVDDGLDGSDAKQGGGLVVGDLRIERRDPAAVVSLVAPGGQIVVELIENLLEKSGVEAGGLPQLRRGRLDEGVRVERVGLRMLALGKIEAEAGSDERPAGFGVGIRNENPAFMAAVAEQVHEIAEAELDVGGLKVDQGTDGGGNRFGLGRGLLDFRRERRLSQVRLSQWSRRGGGRRRSGLSEGW